VAADYPKTAEGLRQTLARIFAFAIRNLRAKTNPARELQGVIVVPPAAHHRPLKAPDIAPFLASVRAYRGRRATVIAAELLLLTCVRKTELLGAKVSELDVETAEWRIPGERMKGGLEHIVPLSTQALELFREAVSINLSTRHCRGSRTLYMTSSGSRILNLSSMWQPPQDSIAMTVSRGATLQRRKTRPTLPTEQNCSTDTRRTKSGRLMA